MILATVATFIFVGLGIGMRQVLWGLLEVNSSGKTQDSILYTLGAIIWLTISYASFNGTSYGI